jgi:hypothetical protein
MADRLVTPGERVRWTPLSLSWSFAPMASLCGAPCQSDPIRRASRSKRLVSGLVIVRSVVHGAQMGPTDVSVDAKVGPRACPNRDRNHSIGRRKEKGSKSP